MHGLKCGTLHVWLTSCMHTHLGYAASVGDSASDQDSLDKPDASGILLENWSLLLVTLDMDALHSMIHADLPARRLLICASHCLEQYLEPERRWLGARMDICVCVCVSNLT